MNARKRFFKPKNITIANKKCLAFVLFAGLSMDVLQVQHNDK